MSNTLEAMAIGAAPWRHHMVRAGRLERGERGSLILATEHATASAYSDAQIDDYGWPLGRTLVKWPLRPAIPLGAGSRERFMRRPPLRLRVRARFSHPEGELQGTAGFGLWNYPIAAPLAMPRAIWFFYGSAPGDLPLALGVPGHSCWKAATVDTGRPRALALAPLAPMLVPLMWAPPLYRGLWPPIQRAVGVAEAPVRVAMTAWHDYTIEWGTRTSRFIVDGRVVLGDAPSPRGPMCLVFWIDNQYMVVTPQGHLGWGIIDVPGRQWLEIAALSVEEG